MGHCLQQLLQWNFELYIIHFYDEKLILSSARHTALGEPFELLVTQNACKEP